MCLRLYQPFPQAGYKYVDGFPTLPSGFTAGQDEHQLRNYLSSSQSDQKKERKFKKSIKERPDINGLDQLQSLKRFSIQI